MKKPDISWYQAGRGTLCHRLVNRIIVITAAFAMRKLPFFWNRERLYHTRATWLRQATKCQKQTPVYCPDPEILIMSLTFFLGAGTFHGVKGFFCQRPDKNKKSLTENPFSAKDEFLLNPRCHLASSLRDALTGYCHIPDIWRVSYVAVYSTYCLWLHPPRSICQTGFMPASQHSRLSVKSFFGFISASTVYDSWV